MVGFYVYSIVYLQCGTAWGMQISAYRVHDFQSTPNTRTLCSPLPAVGQWRTEPRASATHTSLLARTIEKSAPPEAFMHCCMAGHWPSSSQPSTRSALAPLSRRGCFPTRSWRSDGSWVCALTASCTGARFVLASSTTPLWLAVGWRPAAALFRSPARPVI